MLFFLLVTLQSPKPEPEPPPLELQAAVIVSVSALTAARARERLICMNCPIFSSADRLRCFPVRLAVRTCVVKDIADHDFDVSRRWPSPHSALPLAEVRQQCRIEDDDDGQDEPQQRLSGRNQRERGERKDAQLQRDPPPHRQST